MLQFVTNLPEKLKRITSGSEIIREIDGLRFVAIFTVLVQHLHERFVKYTPIPFPSPLEEHNVMAFVATRSFIGVYVFFAISGFILALPFAKKRLSGSSELKLKSYYIRRVTRLEPPYIFWMTALFIVFLVAKNERFDEYLPHYLTSITYTHGLFYQGWSPLNPPTWTLEVEVQFYLLAPFLAWGFFSIKNKTLRRITLISFIVLFMLVQQHYEFFRLPWYLTILAYLQYFLAGFIAADIYLCDWRNKEIKPNTFFDFIAVGSLILIILIWDWEFHFIDRLAEVTLIFTFFYSVFKGNYLNRFLTNRWIMSIGGMCYTIYLIHLPLSEFFMQLTKNIIVTDLYEVNIILQLVMFLPVVFVVSVIGYLLFEKPFMNKDWPKAALAMLNNQAGKMKLWLVNKNQ